MGLFTFGHDEEHANIEKALQGIPWSGDDLLWIFQGKGKKKEKSNSPVYMLKVDTYDDIMYGYFTIDEKKAEAPIGLSRKIGFLRKEYMTITEGNPQKVKRTEGRLYLPLRLTDMLANLGIEKEGKFVPEEGSPFRVYGIRGSHGTFPLICVSDTEEGLKELGFYKTKSGEVSAYVNEVRLDEGKIRKILADDKIGISSDSPKTASRDHYLNEIYPIVKHWEPE